MKQYLILLLASSLAFWGFSQDKGTVDSSWKQTPRYTPTRINNLVHTKLDVRFDYEKTSLIGKAWITLTPHFNPTAALTLDAKGMEIKQVSLVQADKSLKTLEYGYDKKQLSIKLPRTYKKGETYTVYIDYVSKPNEYEKEIGSDPMLGVKGLYFINPKGEEKTNRSRSGHREKQNPTLSGFQQLIRRNKRQPRSST